MSQHPIKRFVIHTITRLENPMAPILLNGLYQHTDAVGRMLAAIGDESQVHALTKRLLSDFTDDELATLASDPNFLIALLSNVAECIREFSTK